LIFEIVLDIHFEMLVLKYSFITFVDSVNDDYILYTNIQKKTIHKV